EPLLHVLPLLDLVLLMTVNPGFGGQAFIPEVRPKIRALREEIDRRGLHVRIEVDGGITDENVAQVARDGADTFVAGSGVFANPRHPQVAAAIAALREQALEGLRARESSPRASVETGA